VDGCLLNEEELGEGANGVGGGEEEVGIEGAVDPEGSHPQDVVEVVEGYGGEGAHGGGIAVEDLENAGV